MERNEKSISGDDSARPWQSYNTVYTTAKAGMEGVDKEKVKRIVYEMSKGSKYFENEERKEAYMKQKVDSMRAQLAKLTASDISHHQKIADKRILELEATRDLSRTWLHVDMDAFYAAVETLANPSLKGKPMAVGGMSMISTANYEARKFGVRAAMPGFIARKLCPELIFVPVDFKKYTYYSDLTRKVFQKYDPNFLAASLDEAYLDITNFCSNEGMTARERVRSSLMLDAMLPKVAEELRESVNKETGLTCSAGVGPNRLLAKVCSDINKPNGQFVLPNERMAVMAFISTLPIRKIGGIGKVTENILNGVFGITTCEEMLQKNFFLSVGLGLGRTGKPEATQRKSMSNERTFSPTEDELSFHQKLVDLSDNLSSDMEKQGLRGRTLTLKLKTSCFEVRSRAVTLPNYICSSEDILKHAKKLLKAELPVSLRLMGLRMSHFSEGREGVAIDPKQKTLSNFIVTGENASGRGYENQALSESNLIDDNDLARHRETSLCSDHTHEPCESIDFVDVPDLDHSDTRHFHYEAETEGSFGLQVDNHDMVKALQSVQRNSPSSGVSSAESSMNRRTSADDEPMPTQKNQKEAMFWLHDYQCSVCGIEMPPSFVEERQEHFDFHLAERLQDEETTSNINRILNPKQRYIEKDQMSRSRQRKKLKASPTGGNHIKIDMFFAKSSQNF
ncbi:DNA polymerase kappa [Phtheirospermum japonicum]|uniref:DNA polymerase kappa n=1 Tax=Phtheirospermum japonicum TaxID=374723 RepID=A0A830BRR5_9LAMI|nr:DNA polymerase kappa [Phtheirospermum japonicum]